MNRMTLLRRFAVVGAIRARFAVAPAAPRSKPARSTKKTVLIAGKKSHPPGMHEYLKGVKLLKVLLDQSSNSKGVRTEVHFNG